MSNPDTQKIEQLTKELYALKEIAKTITSPLELPELLESIMNRLIGVLPSAEVGAVMLWDQSAGLFRPGAAFGYDLEKLRGIGLRAGEGITGKVFNENVATLLPSPADVAEAMNDIRPPNYQAVFKALGMEKLPLCTLAAPIAVDGQKFGVLILESIQGPDTFAEADIPFIQMLADLIAMAIERSRLSAKADAVREAQEAEHMRSELMATLSHELRLPLTAIKGYTTALLMEEIEWNQEKTTEFLQLIDAECDNMQVLLSDMLDSALIDVNQLTIDPKPVSLHQIAREVVAEMQHRTEIHRLIVDISPNFPIVAADPHWIRQVFRNILDNAVKYSPEGGLIVIRGESRTEDVVINIADQGIGISPENLIPLFEKYFRVKPSDGYYVPGTGLGLPVTRAIVEAHDGHIWVESKEGQGTTVSFSLPLFEVPADI